MSRGRYGEARTRSETSLRVGCGVTTGWVDPPIDATRAVGRKPGSRSYQVARVQDCTRRWPRGRAVLHSPRREAFDLTHPRRAGSAHGRQPPQDRQRPRSRVAPADARRSQRAAGVGEPATAVVSRHQRAPAAAMTSPSPTRPDLHRTQNGAFPQYGDNRWRRHKRSLHARKGQSAVDRPGARSSSEASAPVAQHVRSPRCSARSASRRHAGRAGSGARPPTPRG